MPAPPAIAAAKLAYATASRVIEIIRQPLVILDDKFRVVFSNHAFCRTFMISRDEVGRHITTIGDRRLDVASFRDFLSLIEAGGTVVEDYEIEVESPALGSRVLVLSGQPIYDEPTTRETLVMFEDVTERRRADMKLLADKWHSDRASLGKSRILAAASHDLRQQLQTLNLMRTVLAKNIKDDEGSKLIRQLNKTTDVMLGMLDTLLEIKRLEAGVVDPQEVEFPINDLLEQLRIEFTYHAQARGVGWHVVPCGLTVWSDPRLLEQMLRNLLSNAMKYTERGKILFGCRRRGDILRIEVWDTGIGIPEEQLHAIFAEFHQPGNPAHDRTLGFGLGLPIVQRLGHVLGHSIDVHSRPGKGSVFAIEVPLRGRQQEAPATGHGWPAMLDAAGEAAVRTGAPSPANPKDSVLRTTIFVVDDEGALRDAMRELLQEEEWEVEAYPSGEAFLEAYHADREGCLVVDARMPGMSGLELLEQLKAKGGGLPAIMITGHADVRLAVRAMRAGAMAFLEKPVQYGDLVANIERALNLARNSTALSSLREAAAKRMARLTLRERQVVEMVVEGNPNKQIAYILGISQRTVETHRAAAMRKVGARTLSELIHLTIDGSPQGM
ncbi:response regulator [Enhydrobacter sp.]|jgi:two-component system CheB/CheR fusion protein|uniref:response regulator n=1 Tax=Enhydrobacter sp. TaxID=1894999 RepID=UPI0026341519|nr:response regulator [Enhydrobacter sp.]